MIFECQKSWDTKFINKVGASSLEKRALLRPAKSFGASTELEPYKMALTKQTSSSQFSFDFALFGFSLRRKTSEVYNCNV